MPLIERLEKRLRWLTIPNLTLLIIFGQIGVYVLSRGNPLLLDLIALYPGRVWAGEVWRAFTFVFWPPLGHPVFVALAWYFFYLLGSALEGYWGDLRYTIFLLIAWVATVLLALASPLLGIGSGEYSNAFIGGSVFLAFAYLNPNFEILLFFILPVRIKWLALLTWLGYLFVLLFGTWPARLMVLASLSNFLLFFGRDIWITARAGHRRMEGSARRFRDSGKALHCCLICGATEKSHPDYEFRYCSKCSKKACYCMEHLQQHEHI